LIFVLLAAGLPIAVLRAEGWRGLLTVVALMVVVRPIAVAVALRGSPMTFREKLFVAWIAPRGIVAASVASLFALGFVDAGFGEGPRLLAITFLTVGITVTLQGLSAGPLARALRLLSLEGQRVIVVGAGPLGLALAQMLRERERPVILIDRNASLIARARERGFEAVAGNALDETTLDAVGAGDAETLVAVTSNSEVNALAAHLAHEAFGVRRAYPAVTHPSRGAGPELIDRVGGIIAFGHPLDVRDWEHDLESDRARFVTYKVSDNWTGRPLRALTLPGDIAAIARIRHGSVEVAHPDQVWQLGDDVVLMSRATAAATAALLDASYRMRAPDLDRQPLS
jgi:Trk K+ transport system NAD-binding subunit